MQVCTLSLKLVGDTEWSTASITECSYYNILSPLVAKKKLGDKGDLEIYCILINDYTREKF